MTDDQGVERLQSEMRSMAWQMHQLVHFLGLALSVTGPLEIDRRSAELFKASGLEPDFAFSEDNQILYLRLIPIDGE